MRNEEERAKLRALSIFELERVAELKEGPDYKEAIRKYQENQNKRKARKQGETAKL